MLPVIALLLRTLIGGNTSNIAELTVETAINTVVVGAKDDDLGQDLVVDILFSGSPNGDWCLKRSYSPLMPVYFRREQVRINNSLRTPLHL